MSFKHIIWSSILKNWRKQPLKQDWVDQRLYLFERFFLGSLLRQTEQNFEVVLLIRENFKYCVKRFSALADEYRPLLQIQLVKANAEVYPLAPRSVLDACKDHDWVYYTRCDTDDFFSKHAVERIQEQEPDIRTALTFQQGYNYHLPEYRLACWGQMEGPTYTIVFPTDYFVDKKRAFEYGMCKHLQVKKLFNCVRLGNWHYCVTTHERNNSSKPSGHPFRTSKACRQFFDDFPVMRMFEGITLVRTAGRREIVPYSELETYYAHRADSVADP